jgi:hypothetical protein
VAELVSVLDLGYSASVLLVVTEGDLDAMIGVCSGVCELWIDGGPERGTRYA